MCEMLYKPTSARRFRSLQTPHGAKTAPSPLSLFLLPAFPSLPLPPCPPWPHFTLMVSNPALRSLLASFPLTVKMDWRRNGLPPTQPGLRHSSLAASEGTSCFSLSTGIYKSLPKTRSGPVRVRCSSLGQWLLLSDKIWRLRAPLNPHKTG